MVMSPGVPLVRVRFRVSELLLVYSAMKSDSPPRNLLQMAEYDAAVEAGLEVEFRAMVAMASDSVTILSPGSSCASI